MYPSICIDPCIFAKENANDFSNLIKDIGNNGILLLDKNGDLEEKYILKIKELDQETKSFFETHYTYFINNLEDNRQKYFGNIDIDDFQNSILKKIKSFKITKSFMNGELNNIDKEYFVYVITSKLIIESKHLLKQKFAECIQDYTLSPINRKFEFMNKGISIKNKKVDDIIFNYILPIMWFSSEVCFFAKEISTYTRKSNRNINRRKFENFFDKIMNILIKVKKIDKPIIKIITASEDTEIQKENADFIKKIKNKYNKDLDIKIVLHKNKGSEIHPRAIYSDGICVSFDKMPEIDQNNSDYFINSFNRIIIDREYAQEIENEHLSTNF